MLIFYILHHYKLCIEWILHLQYLRYVFNYWREVPRDNVERL